MKIKDIETEIGGLRDKFNSFINLDKKILSLETRLKVLEDKSNSNEIILTSPDGSNRVIIAACNDVAGVWVTNIDTSEIAIYNRPSPTVGVYGPQNFMEGTDAMGCKVTYNNTVARTLTLPEFPV
jgi:hypothetical protein